MSVKIKFPKEVESILKKMEKAGFEAYIVGGCVRDFLLGREPGDWDVTTNAKPDDVQKIFPDSFYKNKFGTVTVKTKSKKKSLKEVEITTYRSEEGYSDKRHPDKVSFSKNIEEDLKRRDFTVNALAIGLDGKIVDLFDGQGDIDKKVIRAVGKASDRFDEDALRMMRAVRLAVQLEFEIEQETLNAIRENANWLKAVAKERIRDEFTKAIMSEKPSRVVELLEKSDLLPYILPELVECVGVKQNRHHIYTVYKHSILSLKFAAQRKCGLEVRLASLLHDIGKPQTKEGSGEEATFYNHEYVGAKKVIKILQRLKFSKKIIEKTALLVRNHMFVYNVDEVSEAGVRRIVKRVGAENVDDLIDVRIADRLGSGCAKAVPYKLRHLKYLIEKVSSDPISVKMLKVDGNDLMKSLDMEPSHRLGLLLNALLAEVLDDPKLNTKAKLLQIAEKLNRLSDSELKKKATIIDIEQEKVEQEMKGRYWVK